MKVSVGMANLIPRMRILSMIEKEHRSEPKRKRSIIIKQTRKWNAKLASKSLNEMFIQMNSTSQPPKLVRRNNE